MKMFIIGFVVAWCVLALLSFVSESIGKGGISLFEGFASTVLTLPLLPFALLYRGGFEIYKKLFRRSKS